jgi:DNA-directed RNA polymerase specialized sigma subunit
MTKKELKALQSEWYKKLEETGFKDIEDTNSPNEYLKAWAKWDFVKLDQDKMAEVEKYFYEARDVFNWYEFANEREQLIWTYHCEGDSIREIAAKIKLAKSAVQRILKKMKFEMQKPN